MNRDMQSDLYNQATGWLMNTARRNPEGLLLLAAGCALLLRSGSGRAGDASSRMSQSFSAERGREGFARPAPEATSYASQASNYASDIKEKVFDTVSEHAQSASEYARETGRMVSERSQQFARQARSSVESGMSRVLREQPLAVALAGLAAGAVVAAAFPATEVEKRTLGAAGEAMADAAEKAKDSVVEAAGKAGERLKSAAEERGLNAEGLKDLAGEVTDAFKDSIAGKGDDHGSATTVPKPGPSGLQRAPSTPADRGGAGVRSPDVAGGSTRGGGSNR
jgi:hypothetical protein